MWNSPQHPVVPGCAGDALALSDSPLESRGRPGEGEWPAALTLTLKGAGAEGASQDTGRPPRTRRKT